MAAMSLVPTSPSAAAADIPKIGGLLGSGVGGAGIGGGGEVLAPWGAAIPFDLKLKDTRPLVMIVRVSCKVEPTTGIGVPGAGGRMVTVTEVAGRGGGGGGGDRAGGGDSGSQVPFRKTPTAAPAQNEHKPAAVPSTFGAAVQR